MATSPYRRLRFGADAVEIGRGGDGTVTVAAQAPLGTHPARMTDCLIHWASVAPERSFMAKRDATGEWRPLRYAEALDGARRIAQALIDRRLDAERPVMILSGNDLEHALLGLGCQLAGIPYAPVSPAYSLVSQDFEKLKHAVKTLTPGLVFAARGEPYARAIVAAVPPRTEVVLTEGAVPGRRTTRFADLLAAEPTQAVVAAYAATGPDTMVKFLFTSGSTRMPKAVVNTQRMLCSNMQMLTQCWPFLGEEPPVLLDWLPWNHTFGGNHNVGIALYHGGTLHIDDGKPTPQLIGETLRNLREVSPTIYFNVPKGFEEIAIALEQDPALRASYFKRLKMQFYAGASLSQPVWDRLHAVAEAACGERVLMTGGFGMTETAPSALNVMQEAVRAGQIGIPNPGLTVRLVPVGDKLELRYRGPNVTPGYWRAPGETAEAFDEEGFFKSGDAVRWFDPERPALGFVFDGRVAEDFKLSTGTWVSVGPLRARVAQAGAPYVQDSVVTGHDRDEVGLLFFPHLELCRGLAQAPADAAPEAVLAAPAVRAFFADLVDRLHAEGTGSANRITRALVLAEPPSIDRSEITDKGSINQRAVLAQRAALVEALHAGTHPDLLKPRCSR